MNIEFEKIPKICKYFIGLMQRGSEKTEETDPSDSLCLDEQQQKTFNAKLNNMKKQNKRDS